MPTRLMVVIERGRWNSRRPLCFLYGACSDQSSCGTLHESSRREFQTALSNISRHPMLVLGARIIDMCAIGLVNCTTIDWFTEWPGDALYEVAYKQLEQENIVEFDELDSLCQVM